MKYLTQFYTIIIYTEELKTIEMIKSKHTSVFELKKQFIFLNYISLVVLNYKSSGTRTLQRSPTTSFVESGVVPLYR